MPARDVRPAAPTPARAELLPTLLSRAEDYYRTGSAFTGHPGELLSGLGDAVGSAYRAVQASQGDERTLARLVDSVLRPLNGRAGCPC
jgi:hypothetical protein